MSDDDEIVICAYCGRNCIPDDDYRCPNCGQMGEFRTIDEGVSQPVMVDPERHKEIERLRKEEERLKEIEKDKYTERAAVLPAITHYRPTRSRSRRRFGISMLEKQMVVAVAIIVLYMAANGFGAFGELPWVPPERQNTHIVYQAVNSLTGVAGPSTMLLDVYTVDNNEMVLMECISHQDTSFGLYWTNEEILLMAYDPTNDMIVPFYTNYIVPSLSAGEVYDGDHRVTIYYVTMPSQWDVSAFDLNGSPLTGDVNVTTESQFMFQVTNHEEETGYMESFDFLNFQMNAAYFFVESDYPLCPDYDMSFQSPVTITYLWSVDAEELCLDRLPDGSYKSMGVFSTVMRINQSAPTTHVRYGLVLNVDANKFLNTGILGANHIVFDDTFVLHEVSA